MTDGVVDADVTPRIQITTEDAHLEINVESMSDVQLLIRFLNECVVEGDLACTLSDHDRPVAKL